MQDQLNLDRKNEILLTATTESEIEDQLIQSFNVLSQLQPEEKILIFYTNKSLKDSDFIVQNLLFQILMGISWKYKQFYQITDVKLNTYGFELEIKNNSDILVGNEKIIIQDVKKRYLVNVQSISEYISEFSIPSNSIQVKRFKNFTLIKFLGSQSEEVKQNFKFYQTQIQSEKIYQRILKNIEAKNYFLDFYLFEAITKESLKKYLNYVLLDNIYGDFDIEDILYYENTNLIQSVKITQKFSLNSEILNEIKRSENFNLQKLQRLLKYQNLTNNQIIQYQGALCDIFNIQKIILRFQDKNRIFIKKQKNWEEIKNFTTQKIFTLKFEDKITIPQEIQILKPQNCKDLIKFIIQSSENQNLIFLQQKNYQFDIQKFFYYFLQELNLKLIQNQKQVKQVEVDNMKEIYSLYLEQIPVNKLVKQSEFNKISDAEYTLQKFKYQQYYLINELPENMNRLSYMILDAIDENQTEIEIQSSDSQEIEFLNKILNFETVFDIKLKLEDNKLKINKIQEFETKIKEICQDTFKELIVQTQTHFIQKIKKILNLVKKFKYQKLMSEKIFLYLCRQLLIPIFIQENDNKLIVSVQIENQWNLIDLQKVVEENLDEYFCMSKTLYEQLNNKRLNLFPVKIFDQTTDKFNKLYKNRKILFGKTVSEVYRCLIDVFKHEIQGKYINCTQYTSQVIKECIFDVFKMLYQVLNIQIQKYDVKVENQYIIISIK